MNHFDYIDGALHAEEVPLADIAAEVGTPFYCYSTATLERHYTVFADAFADVPATVLYSLKANGNLAVVRCLAALGAGADVVSGGELQRAVLAGVPAKRIVFSGVGKTADEMALGLDAGILQFNIESLPELDLLSSVAEARGQRAEVAIRVNPDVDARTHHKITTGVRGNKFGVPYDLAKEAASRAAALPGVTLVGLAMHIGSQLTDLSPLETAIGRLAELTATLRGAGHEIRRLDVGGGLGIRYDHESPPLPDAYAAMVKRATAGLGCELLFEPGRMIAGNAGVLVARVLYTKQAGNRSIVIVDAAMNDLMRPTLYDAYHAIEPVVAPAPGAPVASADVVGPVCESGDSFASARDLPPLAAGELIVLRTVGAYGAVLSSSYNARPLVPEVLVRGGEFAVVRRRPDFEETIALEHMPDWLDPDWLDDAGAGKRGVG